MAFLAGTVLIPDFLTYVSISRIFYLLLFSLKKLIIIISLINRLSPFRRVLAAATATAIRIAVVCCRTLPSFALHAPYSIDAIQTDKNDTTMLRRSQRLRQLSPQQQNTDQQDLPNEPAEPRTHSPFNDDGTVVTLPPSLPSHQSPRSFRTSPSSNPSLVTQPPHTDFIHRPIAHLPVRPHSAVPTY